MFKVSNTYEAICVCFVLFYASSTYSKEYLLETDVDVRAEYNDNILLTSLPHDSVTGLIVMPTIKGVIKESHWQADVAARLRSNNYSNSSLNSNDKYFDLTGNYNAERSIVSLNANYDLDSSLSSTSVDFGITGFRINRKQQSVTPQYIRLMTERLFLTLSYSYTDVEYLDAVNTGFRPYVTQSGTGSLVYQLSEKDKLTFSLTAVDYVSKDNLLTYQLFMPRFGIEHEFSETFSLNFLLGTSKRNSTNLSTQSFDFFGQSITLTREVDFTDRGFVLDAGLTKKLESGDLTGNISRDNTTNSFGGVNEVDRFKVRYGNNVTELLGFSLSGRYEAYNAVGSSVRNTDRKILFFNFIVRYSVTRNWGVNVSYRYIQRRFKSDTSTDTAPYSNRIYVGLTYNLPALSTF